MKREGRVTGYLRGRPNNSRAAREQCESELQALGFSGPFNLLDTDLDIKVVNKPTNESKRSSRCKRKACRGCHARPPSKALSKTKGLRNKLCSSQSRRENCRPCHPSLFGLHDCDEYDTPSDLLHEELDVHSDENVPASHVIGHLHEKVGCDNAHSYADDLPYCVDIIHSRGMHGNRQGCFSAPPATPDEGSDATHSMNMQIADFVVVCDDLVQGPYVCHQNASPSDHQGSSHTPPTFSPHQDGGSIDWCQVSLSDTDSDDDDDWLVC